MNVEDFEIMFYNIVLFSK